MERIATCHCGKLSLRCAGEPKKISLCHCLECQKRTGSLFSIAVFYPRARVKTQSGEAKTYRRPSASGFHVDFHFCPECGSNVWWEPARLSDLIGVAAGAFADPDFPMPEQAVWSKHRHHWLVLPDEIATYPEYPGPAQPRD